ncbi:hypothetical protein QYF61_016201 [Mycteria americana]|uniref:Protein kinase domain-containing protein n=1 Tax=Mycteria americana TaxID=33587 RepID=A0AAN7N486_MYCAM|nr:hypothetical protein QYF61_016201 [Mycteria americana]
MAGHPDTRDPLLPRPLAPGSPQGAGLLTPGLSSQGTFGRCYQLTEVASGRVYAAKVIPRARLTAVGIGERVSLGGGTRSPQGGGAMPTGTPQSPTALPSPLLPPSRVAGWVLIPVSPRVRAGGPRIQRVPRGAAGLTPTQVERERELHGRLRHRHIVRLHGHFADCSHVYLLLEYCSRRVSECQHPKTEHPHAGASPGPELAPRSVPSPSPTSCGPGGG